MILKKIEMHVERLIKQKLGVNPDAKKIRRMETEMRVMRADIIQLKKMCHPKRNLIERDGKYCLEEENK